MTTVKHTTRPPIAKIHYSKIRPITRMQRSLRKGGAFTNTGSTNPVSANRFAELAAQTKAKFGGV